MIKEENKVNKLPQKLYSWNNERRNHGSSILLVKEAIKSYCSDMPRTGYRFIVRTPPYVHDEGNSSNNSADCESQPAESRNWQKWRETRMHACADCGVESGSLTWTISRFSPCAHVRTHTIPFSTYQPTDLPHLPPDLLSVPGSSILSSE